MIVVAKVKELIIRRLHCFFLISISQGTDATMSNSDTTEINTVDNPFDPSLLRPSADNAPSVTQPTQETLTKIQLIVKHFSRDDYDLYTNEEKQGEKKKLVEREMMFLVRFGSASKVSVDARTV